MATDDSVQFFIFLTGALMASLKGNLGNLHTELSGHSFGLVWVPEVDGGG